MSLSKSYETAVRAFLRIEMTPAQIDSAERKMMGRLRKKATAEGHRPPERMVIALWSTFRLLYAFVVLSHCRRETVHVNVTAHPTAAWAAALSRVTIDTPGFLIPELL